MKWFLDMTTHHKLLISFGIVILLLLIVIGTAFKSVTTMQAIQEALYSQEFADALAIKDIRAQQNALRANIAYMMLVKNSNEREALNQESQRLQKNIGQELHQLIERNKDRIERFSHLEQFSAIQNLLQQTRESQTIPLINAGKLDEAVKINTGVQLERNLNLREIADDLVEKTEQSAINALNKSKQMMKDTLKIFAIIGVSAFLISIFMTIYLTKIIAGPLKRIAEASRQIADGDLTVSIPITSQKDEVGMVIQTFIHMIEKLRVMMGEIHEGVNVLASSANEITAATTQVASGSAETAAAVKQTTTTIEEVKQTSDVSAQKAKYVAEIAKKTEQISEDGKKYMEDSINAMHHIQEQMELIAESMVRLSEQSQDIGEIIATVNDLAEQSNLLAVNASIEAAKAGDQGKGFAVVAQEVRSMAEQSKQATAQVRSILGEIQKAMSRAVLATEQGENAVQAGVKLSTDTAETIRLLTENIAESAQAAAQILSSAQQQLIGMDQVMLAMQDINQASSQNVSSTKQAEVAAYDLQKLGQSLKILTDQYKLE